MSLDLLRLLYFSSCLCVFRGVQKANALPPSQQATCPALTRAWPQVTPTLTKPPCTQLQPAIHLHYYLTPFINKVLKIFPTHQFFMFCCFCLQSIHPAADWLPAATFLSLVGGFQCLLWRADLGRCRQFRSISHNHRHKRPVGTSHSKG